MEFIVLSLLIVVLFYTLSVKIKKKKNFADGNFQMYS
jgi:hypothetical protein